MNNMNVELGQLRMWLDSNSLSNEMFMIVKIEQARNNARETFNFVTYVQAGARSVVRITEAYVAVNSKIVANL